MPAADPAGATPGLHWAAGPDLRGLLRDNRELRRLVPALLLSRSADLLGLLAVVTLLAATGTGPGSSGPVVLVALVLTLRVLAGLALGDVVGGLADRVDRRRLLVVTDLLRALLLLSVALLAVAGWTLVAAALVAVVGLAASRSATTAAAGLLPTARRAAAAPLLLGTTVVAASVAALALVLLSLPAGDQTRLVLGVAVAAHLLAVLLSRRTDLPTSPPPPAPGSPWAAPWRRVGAGAATVLGVAVLRPVVGPLLVLVATVGVVLAVGPSWVAGLEAGVGAFGLLVLVVVVGGLAGATRGARWAGSLPPRRRFALAVTGAGLAAVLAAVVPQVSVVVLAAALLGLLAGTARAGASTLLDLEVEPEARAVVRRSLDDTGRAVLVVVLVPAAALAGAVGPFGADPLFWPGAVVAVLLLGVLLTGTGVLAVRALAEGGTSVRDDLREAWRRRGRTARASHRHGLPGYFVAFEGGDGSGKSTQAAMLADWVARQGWEAVRTREPGGTALGRRLRSVLLDGVGDEGGTIEPRAEALLFAADRAQHVSEVIRPALRRGAVVITDRYVDSSLAYQGAGRAESVDEVEQLSAWATGGLVPDLTVVLDVDPSTAAARRGADERRRGEDRLEAESTAFHTAVREQFLLLAEREPRRYLVLDATTSERSVQRRVRAHLEALLDAPDAEDAAAEGPVPARRSRLARRARPAGSTGPVPLDPVPTDPAAAVSDEAAETPVRDPEVTGVLERPGSDDPLSARR